MTIWILLNSIPPLWWNSINRILMAEVGGEMDFIHRVNSYWIVFFPQNLVAQILFQKGQRGDWKHTFLKPW